MNPTFLSDEICVVITNYEFSENADSLKERFGQFFPTILIDSSSPRPPKLVDVTIPNFYYPGLWNGAVAYALSMGFKWLIFVASDVHIQNVQLLCKKANEVTSISNIGVYSASLTPDSRTSFPNLTNNGSRALVECGLVEGFFFMSRTSILKEIYPIQGENRAGWGVDIKTCYQAYQQKYQVVVDHRIQIYHPASLENHKIDMEKAGLEAIKYIGPDIHSWSEEIQEITKNNALSLEHDANDRD